jgi:hypothetical protein
MRLQIWRRTRNIIALVLGLGLVPALWPGPAAGHDIPDQIILRAFVKPEPRRLHFLVRVPLALLLNINLPKRGPGYIDLAHADDAMMRAASATARQLVLYEDDARLTPDRVEMRISLPSEAAFGSYPEAAAHIAGPPLPDSANVFWNQGYFDIHLKYPIASESSRFALDMEAGNGLPNRTKLFIQFLPPNGEVRAYEVHGGSGWLDLDPRWYRAAWTFVQMGFDHILDGTDHLLFLFCLVLPFRMRQFWTLAGIISSFTVAHSITLLAAATGVVPTGNWFPPLIETLIAVSIVYMAIENIVATWLGEDSPKGLRWRWLIAGAFGLIHGFGFSFVLQQELQFAGGHFLLSLLSFNIGVELGQLAVLLVAMPALALLLQRPAVRPVGVIILSALVAHTAWHWMLERMSALAFVNWPWPASIEPTPAWALVAVGLVVLVASALRWLAGRSRLRRLPGWR